MDKQVQKRILFIEDDRKFGQMFHDTLRREGYYVLWQSGPEGANDWVTRTKRPWDMVISDQRMPGELGSSFLNFLYELGKTDLNKLDANSSLYRDIKNRLSDLNETEFRACLKDLKAYPCIRVILSGYAEDDGIHKGLEKGVIHKFISKKQDMDEIVAIIKQLFDQCK